MTKEIFEGVAEIVGALLQTETCADISRVLHRAFFPAVGLAPVECAALAMAPAQVVGDWKCCSLWPRFGSEFSVTLSDAGIAAVVRRASEAFTMPSPGDKSEGGMAEWLPLFDNPAVTGGALLPIYDRNHLVGVLALGFGDGNLPDYDALKPYQVLAARTGVAIGRIGGAHDPSGEQAQHDCSRCSKLHAILEAINDGVLLVSRDRRIEVANRRVIEFLNLPSGEKPEEWRTDKLWDHLRARLANPEIFDVLVGRLDSDLAEEGSGEMEFFDPVYQVLAWSCKPVCKVDGVFSGRLHVARDVTEERRAQRTLSDLTSMIAQELRQAMMPLMGFLRRVLAENEDQLGEEARRRLQYVQSSADRINEVIGWILKVARIEQGELRLRPGPVVIGGVLNTVLAMLKPRLDERKQTVSLNAPDDLPVFYADLDLLSQMLSALMTDVIASAADGAIITVEAFETDTPSQFGAGALLRDGASWGVVRIAVPNNAPAPTPRSRGAAKAKKPANYPGAGSTFGVYIANRFARLLGGGAWATEQGDEEWSLWLGLPLTRAWRNTPMAVRAAPLVILAMPNANKYADLQGHLRNAGYEVWTAGGVPTAQHYIQERTPALILVTRDLPGRGNYTLDGFTQKAKSAGITVLQIAVMRRSDGELLFSLSPNARFEQDVPLVIDYFNVMGLLHLLAIAINRAVTKILVVDDQGLLSPAYRTMLEGHYNTAWVARSSELAMEMVYSLLPNLIIADIDSPRLDYRAMLKSLGSGKRTAWIPMIGFSRTPPPEPPRGLKEVVVYPFNTPDLLAAINRSLARSPSDEDADK